MSWKNWVLNPELISIVLGLAAMALPVAGMARFVEQDMATVEDTANARFLAAMVLLVCTAALNLAAFLLARRRAHK